MESSGKRKAKGSVLVYGIQRETRQKAVSQMKGSGKYSNGIVLVYEQQWETQGEGSGNTRQRRCPNHE